MRIQFSEDTTSQGQNLARCHFMYCIVYFAHGYTLIMCVVLCPSTVVHFDEKLILVEPVSVPVILQF